MHLHLGKNRTTQTVALTTAGLATAGLLAAAIALLPLGASADDSAEPRSTLTSENSEAVESTPTAGASAEPAPESTEGVAPAAAEASARATTTPTPESDQTAAVAPEPVAPEPQATADQTTDETTDALLTPRQSWLGQQQLVRECMAADGHEYLYYEWWNPAYDRADGDHSDPSMPEGLTAAEAEAWTFALHGKTGGGPDYVWQDAGCWGAIAEQLGRTS